MKVKRPTGPVDEPDWRYHLNQRLGAEFIAGAEEEIAQTERAAIDRRGAQRVLRRYPGGRVVVNNLRAIARPIVLAAVVGWSVVVLLLRRSRVQTLVDQLVTPTRRAVRWAGFPWWSGSAAV